MSLIEHAVPMDHFEPEEREGFCFPCCCCQYRHRCDFEYPCNECGHNTNAEPYGDTESSTVIEGEEK